MGVDGERGKQRLVCEDIDASREAPGRVRDQRDRLPGKHVRPTIAGSAHAEGKVACDLVIRQRAHAEALRDAVLELAQRWPAQCLVELGLTEEHDLQELVATRLEVGQQPYLLERLFR